MSNTSIPMDKIVTNTLQLLKQDITYQVIHFPNCPGDLSSLQAAVELFFSHNPILRELVGILFLASDLYRFSYICQVSSNLSKQQQQHFTTASDWTTPIHRNLSETSSIWEKTDDGTTGTLKETNGYPDKIREEFTAQAFAILRQRNLLPPPEEEYIVDLEAAGLDAW